MSLIGKLKNSNLFVYQNVSDGKLWFRKSNSRKKLHGNHRWVRMDGREFRGTVELASPVVSTSVEEHDEELSLAIALSLSEQAATVPMQVPVAPEEEAQCTICLEQVLNNARALACGHLFHSNCIQRWVATHHNCPICRVRVRS